MEKLMSKLNKRNDTIFSNFLCIGINVHIFWVKWFEDVYEHGFAYGSKGDKLKYKRVIVSMTLNCRKDEFLGKYTIDKVISPWIDTCDYTKQKFIGYENTYDIPF